MFDQQFESCRYLAANHEKRNSRDKRRFVQVVYHGSIEYLTNFIWEFTWVRNQDSCWWLRLWPQASQHEVFFTFNDNCNCQQAYRLNMR